ncbi:DUF6247 family protein [Streptacidiphilus sp. ASG 303]|uniref:DUF6247 family protein n=1 Tax=Streptacidiphilus sp. ASG 303 TaxID=2896847 RepID=UPI001E28D842|nr:DUF6247 family protein [Streptacidiphilus sp. ASG 303]MCD0486088.1 DUF6247 family protein [Streptacidiphilus sp. ASG 303]
MSAQPEHHGHDEPLIGRPERTPAALRVALARVAPHRLAEMERQKDEVIALAARTGRLDPITQFLEAWAVVVEIARFPGAAARLHAAEQAVQRLDRGDPAWSRAVADIRSLQEAARRAVAGE